MDVFGRTISWTSSVSTYSVTFFLVIFLGYRIQSAFLQYYFYVLGKKGEKDLSSWKIQPTRGNLAGVFWGDPLFSSKPDRAPFHRYVAAFNLLMASTFAGVTCELAVRGSPFSKIRFEMIPLLGCEVTQLNSITDLFTYMSHLLDGLISNGLSSVYDTEIVNWCLLLFLEVLGIVLWQSVLEYYWHRMMHLPYFYTRFHKWHHYYKAPEPWDDLYIHPIEALGYYCILYSSSLLPVHVLSFITYMVIMGLAGVADHSGIKIQVPYIYNSVDHDNHHKHFHYNYAFPFPFMDQIGGTYLPAAQRSSTH